MRAQRSSLYVPGDRPERFAKAIASGADAVILDLEDSVASAAREIASAQVDAFLAQHLADGKAATVWVRVDDATTRAVRLSPRWHGTPASRALSCRSSRCRRSARVGASP